MALLGATIRVRYWVCLEDVCDRVEAIGEPETNYSQVINILVLSNTLD